MNGQSRSGGYGTGRGSAGVALWGVWLAVATLWVGPAWVGSASAGPEKPAAVPGASSSAMTLDLTRPWRVMDGWDSPRKATDVSLAYGEAGLNVTVNEAGKAAWIDYPFPAYVDLKQTPMLKLTYRSHGQSVSWDDAATITARGGSCGGPGAAALVMLDELIHDGQTHTLRIDAVAALADRPDFPHVLPELVVWAYGGADGPATLEILGLTFEPAGPMDVAALARTASGVMPEKPDVADTPETDGATPLHIKVVDERGEPLEGATVLLDPSWQGVASIATTDADGLATVAASDPSASWARRGLMVTHGDRIPAMYSDVSTAQIEPGDVLTVPVYPATSFGGVVVDQDGEPIPHAVGWLEVFHWSDSRDHTGRPIGTGDQPVVADANGRWLVENQADDPTAEVRIGWRTPGYAIEAYAGEHGGWPERSAFKAHAAVSTLPPALTLTGVVTAADGTPLPGVLVAQGDDRVGGSDPTTYTDDAGRFTFDGAAAGSVVLTVLPEGDLKPLHAPELRQVTVTPGMDDVNFELPAAARYAFEITDEAGEPLQGVGVFADTWRGYRSLDQGVDTDEHGRAEWFGPPDGVEFDIHARGRLRQSGVMLQPTGDGEPHRVTMAPPLSVTLSAVDAETGEAITDFRVVTGLRWDSNPNRAPHWDTHQGIQAALEDGTWSATYTFDYPFRVFRIEADGYAPATSEAVPSDAGDFEQTLELSKSAGITGQLVDADGSPMPGVEVMLAPAGQMPQINNGQIRHNKPGTTARTDEAGQFTFPSQGDQAFTLLVLDDAGFAMLRSDDLADASDDAPLTLTVEPWGAVEGTIFHHGQPAAGRSVAAYRQITPEPGTDHQRLWETTPHFNTTGTVNPDGTFRIDRLPAGDYTVGLRLEMPGHGWRNGNTKPLTVEPGQAATMTLGDVGRPVVGKLVWSDADDAPENRPMNHGHASLRPDLSGDLQKSIWESHLPDGFSDWEQEDRSAYLQSEEGQEAQQAALAELAELHGDVNYNGVELEADGTFRVDAVTPGNYILNVQIHEPPSGMQCGWGETIGEVNHKFVIGDSSGESEHVSSTESYIAEPIDLGTIDVSPVVPSLAVGSEAPDFEVPVIAAAVEPDALDAHYEEHGELPDAATFRLSDQRGKVTLIDFWAVWCGPCTAETPNLKAVWDAFGDDPRFAMVALSLDPSPKEPAKYAAKHELGWTNAFLGEWGQATLPGEFGVRGIPSIWLIGPDGKVINKDLRGGNMVDRVRAALDRLPATTAQATP